ncbi:response regulator [Glycomyces buryatensis]|uniref:Response regulator n=1 Tax=Glycomyces buryatensis TaxID=2570927 RepID=A0A4S8QHS7_9ACTN|nr:response regulator [Glycomyces buryatensis]THV40949.1 response regulator [Glycomyces buryatensis]
MSTARVLLVDDRSENLLALEAILQGLPVATIAVTSGEEALKRLLSEDFAAILLDAQMPGMDGFETARHIKQREKTRHTPIIFLTAADRDAHLAMRGYSVGAVDYITKPFDPWMLRTKVKVFIDLWSQGQELRRGTERTRDLREREHDLTRRLEQAHTALSAWRNKHGEDTEIDRILSVLAPGED